MRQTGILDVNEVVPGVERPAEVELAWSALQLHAGTAVAGTCSQCSFRRLSASSFPSWTPIVHSSGTSPERPSDWYSEGVILKGRGTVQSGSAGEGREQPAAEPRVQVPALCYKEPSYVNTSYNCDVVSDRQSRMSFGSDGPFQRRWSGRGEG